MSYYDYKLAVIGAGPGGYTAAIRAAQMGMKTCLIEADRLGGVCLNRGCIPTKSIIASVERLRSVRGAGAFGVKAGGEPSFDMAEIIARKDKIVEGLALGIRRLIEANKIDYINGFAHIKTGKKIIVADKTIAAENIIIATGSTWRSPQGIVKDGKRVISSDDALNLREVPNSICILGGGVIGCEFAYIFSELGAHVTIVEAEDRILPMEDESVSKLLHRSFKKRGIDIITGSTDIEAVKAEKLLVAIGRKPLIEGFGLEETGVLVENGAVLTDTRMKTNIEGIYAIGDVNGRYMLAHVASHEAIAAVQNISGADVQMDYGAVPRPIYTSPEICAVGETADRLKKRGVDFREGRFFFAASPKAICDGETDGEVIIYEDAGSGRLLGAVIIGPHATELGGEVALAVKCGLTAEAVAHTIHSHPTLSEAVMEAAADCLGLAIHKIRRKGV